VARFERLHDAGGDEACAADDEHFHGFIEVALEAGVESSSRNCRSFSVLST
jgi:hypothetical protein